MITSTWGGGCSWSGEDWCWILTNEYNCCVTEGEGGLAKRSVMPRLGRWKRARCVLQLGFVLFSRELVHSPGFSV